MTLRRTLRPTHRRFAVPALPLLLAAVLATPTLAQEDAGPPALLDEIVVTAQKREESLKDVPISVSAVSGDVLADRSIDNLADLSSSIPNLFITESQISNHINIRGIRTGANKGFEQSVALYVDGVYYGRDQLIRLPLVDLERVEVLRGPQPTLFGKNAIAGALSVTSALPTDEFEASFSTSWEFQHDELQIQAMVSGPLTETLSGRLVASWREMDGWIDNEFINTTEPAPEELFLRGILAFDDGGPFRAHVKVEYAEFDTEGRQLENNTPIGTYSAVFSGPLAVDTNEDWKSGSSRVNSQNEVLDVVLNAEFELGEYTLTSVSSYVTYDTSELIDVDYIPADLLDGTNQGEDYEQFSQEFRITSPGGEFVDFIAGVYFQDNELEVFDEVFFGSTFLAFGPPFAFISDSYTDRLYEQESTLWSVFAQADINFTDWLTLTLGARYNDEDKEGRRRLDFVAGPTNIGQAIPFPPFPNALHAVLAGLNMFPHDISGERNESSFDPLVRFQFQVTDEVLLYASYTEGTKAGGFDIRGNSVPGHPVATPGTFEFEEEEAESYEVGAKLAFPRFELNMAVYRTEYTDLQTNIFDGTLNFLVLNASEITTQGVEVDGRVAIADWLHLYASAAYLDFEYDDFESAQCAFGQTPLPTGFCSLTGETASHAPEWTANVGLDFEYELPGSGLVFDANLNLDYSDEYFLMASLDPNQVQDDFWKVGASIGIADAEGRWRVSLIGENLTNERIKLTGGALPLATTITGGTGIAYDSFYDRPRNVTLKLDLFF